MYKKLLIIAVKLIMLMPLNSFSQKDDRRMRLENLLNSEFSKIINGNAFSTFGNYASLATTNESMKLSTSWVLKNASILNFDVSGGASDGIATLFNNTKLNSNVNFGVSYHKMINPFGRELISRNVLKVEEVQNQMEEYEILYKEKINNLNFKVELRELYENNQKLKKKEIELDSLCAIFKCDTELVLNLNSSNQELKVLKLRYEKAQNEIERSILLKKIAFIEDDIEGYLADKRIELENERATKQMEFQKAVSSIPAESINVSWFSIGYRIKRNSFKLFDESQALEDQLSKMNNNSEDYFIAFSNYKWKSFENKNDYWSFGLNLGITDNLNELKKLEIQDFKPVSNTSNRVIFSKEVGYQGTYKRDLKKVKIFYDLYKYFGVNNDFPLAFHISPELNWLEKSQLITSLKLGLLLPFKKQDNPKTIINVEAFIKFNDLLNRATNSSSVLAQNSIGLQVSFPFNFQLTK